MSASRSPRSTRHSTDLPEARLPDAPEPQGCLGGLARMFWMVFGNGALILLTLTIARSKRMTYLDVLFWALVIAMIIVRYVDITRLAGQTTSCGRASLRDWRRYVVVLAGIAAVAWALAHVVLGALFA